MAKQTIKVQTMQAIRYDGKLYRVGSFVDMDENQVQSFEKLGRKIVKRVEGLLGNDSAPASGANAPGAPAGNQPPSNEQDDIVLENDYESEADVESIKSLMRLGVKEQVAVNMLEAGYDSPEMVAASTIEELTEVNGVGKATAEKLLAKANEQKDSK